MAADRHDRNLLIVLAGTGARRSEILRLTWTDDVNWKDKTIRLWNRKSKHREIRSRHIQFGESPEKERGA